MRGWCLFLARVFESSPFKEGCDDRLFDNTRYIPELLLARTPYKRSKVSLLTPNFNLFCYKQSTRSFASTFESEKWVTLVRYWVGEGVYSMALLNLP